MANVHVVFTGRVELHQVLHVVVATKVVRYRALFVGVSNGLAAAGERTWVGFEFFINRVEQRIFVAADDKRFSQTSRIVVVKISASMKK